jgi:hypothetical protein
VPSSGFDGRGIVLVGTMVELERSGLPPILSRTLHSTSQMRNPSRAYCYSLASASQASRIEFKARTFSEVWGEMEVSLNRPPNIDNNVPVC